MRIEFGILNYKLLILLLHPIFNQVRVFQTHKDTSPLYDSFISSIGYLSGGLIYLLVLHRSTNENQSSNIKKSVYIPARANESFIENQIYIDNKTFKKQRKIKETLFIFLLAFINLIPMIIESFASKMTIYDTIDGSIGALLYILFYVSYSKIFLKLRIYSHQLLSLVIIFSCLFIYFLIDIFKITKDSFNPFTLIESIVYFIVVYGLYSLYDVLTKKHFEIYSNIPYRLMYYIGLFSLVLLIPLDLIVRAFKIKIFGLDIIDQIIELFSSKPLFILWFIFDIIVGFFWLGGIVLTLYYYTPCHFIISEALCQFLSRIIGWIVEKESPKYEWYFILIHCFLYIIIFISSLIYNEVIIVKIWSLEENTFKYISLRHQIEFENIKNINNDLPPTNCEAILDDKDEDEDEEKVKEKKEEKEKKEA